MQDKTYILPAEHFGIAKAEGGKLNIGGLEVPWDSCPDVHVYLRRSSKDLTVFEIHMARHDGLAQESLDQQNEEVEKEYWRARFRSGSPGTTDERFEAIWGDDDE